MTGNTKIWRAPLAGLASVAMIATMGMAAATANASATTPEVTLDANHGVIGSEATKVISDSSTPGWLDDLYTANVPTRDNYTFSGWYTTKKGGEAVDPNQPIADGTRLYAHWIKTATVTASTVNFTLGNAVEAPTAAGNVVNANGTVLLASGDTLAAWQVPSEDKAGDSKLFSGAWQKDGKDVAVKDMKGGEIYTAKTEIATTVTYTVTHPTFKKVLENGKDITAADLGSTDQVVPRDYKLGSTITPIDVYSGAANAWVKAKPKYTPDVTDNKNGTVTLPADTANVAVSFEEGITQYRMLTGQVGESASKTADQVAMVEKDKYASTDVFTDPVMENGTFKGWSKEETAASRGESNLFTTCTLSKDTTVYAWFETEPEAVKNVEISFDLNYDNADVIVVENTPGTFAKLPAEPTREGYKFDAWYSNADGTGTQITEDTLHGDTITTAVYYAKWSPDTEEPVTDLLYKAWNYPHVSNDIQYGTTASKSFTDPSVADYKDALKGIYEGLTSTQRDALKHSDKSQMSTAFKDEDAADVLAKVRSAQDGLVFKTTSKVYRLFNKKTLKHHYTDNQAEVNNLILQGWKLEGDNGIAFEAPSFAGNEQNTALDSGFVQPVYRLFNKYDASGKQIDRHFFTTNEAEYEKLCNDPTWRDEDIAWYARVSGGVTVYRTYSSDRYEHLYTTNKTEAQNSVKLYGYRDEGTAFNAE